MNKQKNKMWILGLMLVIAMMLAACDQVQLPTAVQGTSVVETETSSTGSETEAVETPVAADTPGAGEGIPATGGESSEDQPSERTGDSSSQDDEDGDLIPPDGPIAETPAEAISADERFPAARPNNAPLITIAQDLVGAGQEIVVNGIGFENASAVEIYAGRPDVGSEKTALATAQANENGQFSVHLVLPDQLPDDAVTQGQLLLSAAVDGEVQAMWVVLLGGSETGFSQSPEPGNIISVDDLGFNFEQVVVPLFNLAHGAEFDMADFIIDRIERTDWQDGCLGLGAANEACIQQITPGYLIRVTVDGQQYQIRTDELGQAVRFGDSVPAP